MEKVMKSVGLTNKFGNIEKWQDKTETTLIGIDKSLSFINSALSLYLLENARVFISENEYQKLKELKMIIKKFSLERINYAYNTNDSSFKFVQFTEELDILQQQIESTMELLKSSRLFPLVSCMLNTIDSIWITEYGDIEKRN